jgi:hypothetical protein
MSWKRSVLALAAACLVAAPAAALVPVVDQVPGATLLLPYFEVDLGNPNGINTVFSVNNASATAILAHVVVWSDLSVPVLDFNIYLTGYDVQNVNLHDIFTAGVLPQTASAGQDPDDSISPHGLFSQDINFASCSGVLPPPVLNSTYISHLQASLTGKASPLLSGLCAGRALGDNVARGYVTIDTVNNCSLRFPGDPGYFGSGGTGDITNQNVLFGDYFIVNVSSNFAEGGRLVAVEADSTNPETSVAGQYTFYGRYDSWTAADNREPLATNFAARYLNGGTFNGGTDFTVWRDSKVNQAAFACPATLGLRPAWYPLGQEGIVIFDEEENPDVPATTPVSPQPIGTSLAPFPAETQRVKVGGPALPVPFEFGWIYLDLNTSVAPAGSNPPEDPLAAQAFVIVGMDAVNTAPPPIGSQVQGLFRVGFPAVTLDSAASATHFAPGGSGIR